jgi:hypothetical protein
MLYRPNLPNLLVNLHKKGPHGRNLGISTPLLKKISRNRGARWQCDQTQLLCSTEQQALTRKKQRTAEPHFRIAGYVHALDHYSWCQHKKLQKCFIQLQLSRLSDSSRTCGQLLILGAHVEHPSLTCSWGNQRLLIALNEMRRLRVNHRAITATTAARAGTRERGSSYR